MYAPFSPIDLSRPAPATGHSLKGKVLDSDVGEGQLRDSSAQRSRSGAHLPPRMDPIRDEDSADFSEPGTEPNSTTVSSSVLMTP